MEERGRRGGEERREMEREQETYRLDQILTIHRSVTASALSSPLHLKSIIKVWHVKTREPVIGQAVCVQVTGGLSGQILELELFH